MENKDTFLFVWGIFAAPRLPTESCGTSSANAGSGRRLRSTRPGTYAGHTGELPMPACGRAASRRGYELTHRARQIREEDFGKFDMIVVMDDRNYEHVHRLAPSRADAARIFRMREFFSRHPGWDHVPDPYYEGAEGFELVLDMLEDGCEGILAHLGK